MEVPLCPVPGIVGLSGAVNNDSPGELRPCSLLDWQSTGDLVLQLGGHVSRQHLAISGFSFADRH